MDTTTDKSSVMREIAIKEITASRTNPRKLFDEESLADLAKSITSHGVLSPILVRPSKTGFELIAGERRLRAARLAKLKDIPAIIRELDDKSVLEIQVIENLQRSDLGPMEEAEGYQALIGKHGYTQELLASKVGKSVSYITKRLQLINLCEEGKTALSAGQLPVGHALMISRVADTKVQIGIVNTAMTGAGFRSLVELAKFIEDHSMKALSAAPFKIGDAELLPKAGACTTCPYNTSISSELFNDFTKDAHCTSPACYREKVNVFWRNTTAECQANGMVALGARDTKRIFDYRGKVSYGSNYVEADDKIQEHPQKSTWKKAIGKRLQPVLALYQDKVHRLFVKSEAMAVIAQEPWMQKSEALPTQAITDYSKLRKEQQAQDDRSGFTESYIIAKARKVFTDLVEENPITALKASCITIDTFTGGEVPAEVELENSSLPTLVDFVTRVFISLVAGDAEFEFAKVLLQAMGINTLSLDPEIEQAYADTKTAETPLQIPVEPKHNDPENKLTPINEDGTRDAPPIEGDYTEKVLQRILSRTFQSENDKNTLNAIERWRAWQTEPDLPPTWGEWAEFDVTIKTIKGDRKVTVLYEPEGVGDADHFGFHGPLSSTGYFSLFIRRAKEIPEVSLFDHATNLAHKIYDDHRVEFLKSERKRKPKKEVAA